MASLFINVRNATTIGLVFFLLCQELSQIGGPGLFLAVVGQVSNVQRIIFADRFLRVRPLLLAIVRIL